MATTTKLMTAEDLAQLPDDGCRYELIRGELLCMSPAGGRHGRIQSHLHVAVATYVQQHGLGECYGAETGFLLSRDPDVVLAPDLAFISRERVPTGDDEIGFPAVSPDFVAEIVSPSDRSRDVVAKAHEYLEAGVKMIWLVNPQDQMVTIFEPEKPPYTLTRDDELTGGDVLPDFTLPLSTLFQEPGSQTESH